MPLAHGWKTTSAEKLRRIEECVRVLVCGGELSDIRAHAEAEAWGVTDHALWAYRRKAFALIRRRTDRNRSNLLSRHLAARRLIQARALESGDLKTALDAMRDECRLLGLYPDDGRHRITNITHNRQLVVIEQVVSRPEQIADTSALPALPAPEGTTDA